MMTKRSDAGRPQVVTVRRHRHLGTMIERAEPGDLLVLDHRDLDATTARSVAAAEPSIVLNVDLFITGRYANLGPQVLVDAGVRLLEVDRDAARVLRDGAQVRYADQQLWDGEVAVLPVHEVTPDELAERLAAGRSGMGEQLGSFAHTAGVLLRREEDLLLHGRGLPTLRTRLTDRPVVVISEAATAAEIAAIRRFVRQQRAVVIAEAGSVARVGRRRAEVIITRPQAEIAPATLRHASEVIVLGEEDLSRQLAKSDLPIHRVSTSLPAGEVGMLVAAAGAARCVIPVGAPADLDALVDRDRSEQAAHFLTRLNLGARWIEPSSVPLLYTGRVRTSHLLLLLLLAIAVLGVSVLVTPVGQEWWQTIMTELDR